MSQLIQMRQRIKAIETIKKVTHAMRLISMSAHSHLKHREATLKQYQHKLSHLFAHVYKHAPAWHNPLVHTPQEEDGIHLVILVSSQKGLCGNFNSELFKLFEQYIADNPNKNRRYIPIGKKACDYLEHEYSQSVQEAFPLFTQRTLNDITNAITDHITTHESPYASVTIISNTLKSFFIQKPHIHPIVPYSLPAQEEEAQPEEAETTDEYTWEESPTTILNHLVHQTVEGRMLGLFFESLLAEHAARFVSMDNATRNANTLLDTTRLLYNKLRQAKITKELTELTGSFKI